MGEKDKMTNILRFVFALLTVLNCTRGIHPEYRVISGDDYYLPERDLRGWTLNSIGYNRGFDSVLKRLIDQRMLCKKVEIYKALASLVVIENTLFIQLKLN